ncbi:hypothetical protein HNQ59_001787 [Chitinivorax tropicus]|uniref:Metalloenzyme domain-containing protein n=1 Tax=Chitinivorax tropicus TaxID=714531 RepID=A0A840MIM2_9PROT|nr:alkaline phosphatase family protein [Chitinivorax tropicus]MBB5018498.1 hypothetical protein [Chitinivorax tropicus]
MFRQRVLSASCLLAVMLGTAHAADPKVLLVGIDGVQYQKLQAVNPVNFSRLYSAQSYTGGVAGAAVEQSTVSGPGWSTILTGVWAGKHGVYSNDKVPANPAFPSLFKRIRDARPNAYIASINNWASINENFYKNDVATNNLTVSGIDDQAVTDRAVDTLKNTAADFTFVHLDDPDHAGHTSCFGAAYDQSLRDSDRRLGQMLDAVAARQAKGEDWLVLVTTDHGRDSAGCNHGQQTVTEKTTFIASNKPLNREFTDVVQGLENSDFGGIYGRPAQTSIAPTVLRHLGIPLQSNWLLDGSPLIGNAGVRKLIASRSADADFRWSNDDASPVQIYRNGLHVATVPASQNAWKDPSPQAGQVDYNLVLNDTAVALRINSREIQATLDWDNTRSFFFLNGGSYVRYNQSLDRADAGYPKPVDDSTWPGLAAYKDQIVAAFSRDNTIAYVFLKDGRYIRYNKAADKVDAGYPKNIDNLSWPGVGPYGKQIRATFRWPGNKVFFFLNDGRYIRYDLAKDAADAGYPLAVTESNWPGLARYSRDIIAAMKWDDSRGYIFLTGRRFIRYNISADRAEQGYPKQVDNHTWPGLGVY